MNTDLGPVRATIRKKAGPIAERSKSSDYGRGDPGSNPGEGRFFLLSFRMVN